MIEAHGSLPVIRRATALGNNDCFAGLSTTLVDATYGNGDGAANAAAAGHEDMPGLFPLVTPTPSAVPTACGMAEWDGAPWQWWDNATYDMMAGAYQGQPAGVMGCLALLSNPDMSEEKGMAFTDMLEENGLEEEFQDALDEEGITEEQFFEEIATEMENEFAESGMESFTDTSTDALPPIEEDTVVEEPTETTEVETTEVETETVVEETPTESETVNTSDEAVESEPETTETNTEPENTESETDASSETPETDNEETPTETETTEGETESTETENDSSNEQEESSSDVEESVGEEDGESTTTEEASGDASVDGEVDTEVGEITKKVEKIIKKLTAKLKNLDQKLKVISMVTQQAMINDQPDMSEYTQKQFYDTRKIPDNPDWYAEDTILDAYGRSIYQDKTLVAYQTNDPIFQHNEQVNNVNENIRRLEAELEVLKNENN